MNIDKPAQQRFVNNIPMKHSVALFLVVALSLLTTGTRVHAENVLKDGVPRYVQTEIVPEFTTITPGEPFTVAIVQTIAPEWHTYWKNPGDSGESLSVDWTMPPGFVAGDLQWPAPHRINIGPLTNFGYSEKVVFLSTIAPPADLTGKEVTLKADLQWLVCQELCVPETTTISVTIPISTGRDDKVATNPELFTKARKALPQQVAWAGMVEEQNGKLILTFTPEESNDAPILDRAVKLEFYPYEWGLIQNAASQDNSFDGKKLSLNLLRDSRELQKVAQIEGVVTFEDANGVPQSVIVQVPVPATAAVIETLAKEEMSANTVIPVPDISLWQALALALAGGLILNLMPCVFPVLSMKALSLVKMSEREQSHAVMHGVMYTAGIMVCFGIIAATLIALQHAGQQIGWGFQLQSPVVVLLLAYLLFLIGLNLSGVFDITGSRLTNLGYKLTQKQGYTGSFFTGMLATIVATPCTAPFMGAAMGYALTQSAIVSLSVFMALGLGLALPYLLLTIVPALRKMLPRPGAWMETFRQFLAFPMYASVAWLVWVYGQQVESPYGILLAGFGIVFIALGIWIWGHTPLRQPVRTVVRVLALAAFALAFAIAALSMMRAPVISSLATDAPMAGVQHAGAWSPFTPKALETALQGNDPVFVDMTAAWCITCKVNERVAIAVDSTQALFKEKKVLYLIGDWTNQNAEITAYLKTYGRNGVPLYVFYPARDLTTNTRPEPIVLPQLLTPGLIADIINNT